ncbi:MAG TPA: hypothetical protein VM141_01210 [Planctomycetota bacterium]|nr:hypothetical protein [Planctomycetota bacterium]
MTAKHAARTTPIRLEWSERERSVHFIPEDQDQFALTVEEVMLACQAYERGKRARIQTNMKRLLNELGAWISDHQQKITEGILTKRDNGLFFLVIMAERRYDDELETELAKLDLAMANDDDLAIFQLSVLALPNCERSEYESFVDPTVYLTYQQRNAQNRLSHQPGCS